MSLVGGAPEFLPGYITVTFVFMHKTEPFDTQHIEQYLGHNNQQQNFEIFFILY
jgi:hypothetical protein